MLECILKGLEVRPPRLEDNYLVIPGWGFELYIKSDSVGSLTGFLNDTSG